MQKGALGYDQIHNSTEHYDLEGMISPNFVNNGQTTARVLFEVIPPGGQVPFYIQNLVLSGTIPIRFNSEPGKKDLVTVYYGTLVKDNCN